MPKMLSQAELLLSVLTIRSLDKTKATVFSDVIQDALMSRIGVAKVYWFHTEPRTRISRSS